MFAWLRKKNPTTQLKEVQIGDGNLTLDLPSHFTIESEEDKTTVAYDPAFTDAVARFSTLYITNELNPNVKGLALDHVTQSAKEKGYRLKKADDKLFYSHVEQSQQVDEPGNVHYWVIGLDNVVAIVSCWVSQEALNQPQAQDLLDSIEPAIHSLRFSKVQQYKLEEKLHQDILPLSAEHSEDLDRWRQSVYSFARTFPQGYRFLGTEADLATLQTLLTSGSLDKKNSFLLEGLGVIFGDILAKRLDLHWVTESDDWGTTPALQYHDSGIMLFATDMIIKRVERGEEVDVIDLFNMLVVEVRKMIASGDS